jgi:N utilization substance protein B
MKFKNGETNMTRQQEREETFLMLCEYGFDTDRFASEIYETAQKARQVEDSTYISSVLEGVIANRMEIDELISANSSGWKISRLSVVTAAILRLATYEMLYCADIPVNVSMNEAIELAKKFDDEKARGFVNGVLNAIAKKVKAERGEDA